MTISERLQIIDLLTKDLSENVKRYYSVNPIGIGWRNFGDPGIDGMDCLAELRRKITEVRKQLLALSKEITPYPQEPEQ